MKRRDKYGNEILDRPSPPGNMSLFPLLVSSALGFSPGLRQVDMRSGALL